MTDETFQFLFVKKKKLKKKEKVFICKKKSTHENKIKVEKLSILLKLLHPF